MTRVLIPIGLLVAALGGWLVFRGGDDAAPTESEQATATERAPARPVLPSNQAHVRTPYWKKSEVRAATTGTPDTAGTTGTTTGTATDARGPDEVRTHSAQAVLQRSRPGSDPEIVTNAEIDRAVARAEAKGGQPLTKERRMELEKQLAARKQPQQDRVPGANQMREIREKAACTAPDAQQKYAAMSDADKLRMRQRCGKYGFVPAS